MLAAAGAPYQIRIANYMLWFYALGAAILNTISHFVFPMIEGGYFPGLYTASGRLSMSALLIYLLVKESKQLMARAMGVGETGDHSDDVLAVALALTDRCQDNEAGSMKSSPSPTACVDAAGFVWVPFPA